VPVRKNVISILRAGASSGEKTAPIRRRRGRDLGTPVNVLIWDRCGGPRGCGIRGSKGANSIWKDLSEVT